MPYGTNTIFFIPKEKVPAGRTVTYEIIVAEIIPQKAETHCTRLTVGENLINFPGDVASSTVNLITAYIIFSSVAVYRVALILLEVGCPRTTIPSTFLGSGLIPSCVVT